MVLVFNSWKKVLHENCSFRGELQNMMSKRGVWCHEKHSATGSDKFRPDKNVCYTRISLLLIPLNPTYYEVYFVGDTCLCGDYFGSYIHCMISSCLICRMADGWVRFSINALLLYGRMWSLPSTRLWHLPQASSTVSTSLEDVLWPCF